jgi:hypothetical protein
MYPHRKKFGDKIAKNDDLQLSRLKVSISSPVRGSIIPPCRSVRHGPVQAGFQAWPIGLAFDHQIISVAGEAIDDAPGNPISDMPARLALTFV